MLKIKDSFLSKYLIIIAVLFISLFVIFTLNYNIRAQSTQTPSQVVDFIATDDRDHASRLLWTNPNPNDDTITEIVVRRKEGSFPESHEEGTEVANITSPQPGEILRREDSNLDTSTYYYAVFTKNDSGNWNDTVTEGENADKGYGEEIELNARFLTTLDSVDPPNNSFVCSFNATPISTDEASTGYTWIFNEETKKDGNDLSHAFSSGLGKAYPVELIIRSDNYQSYKKRMVNGLGGVPGTLQDALNAGDSTALDDLKSDLDWDGGSLEKIYLASVKVALKIYNMAQEYGLVSATTLASAVEETYREPLPISGSKVLPHNLDKLLPTFTSKLDQFETLKEPLAKMFPSFNDWRKETSIVAAATTNISFTVPELYTELEELLTFTDDIISELSPILKDDDFELQIPTYSATPNYIALDNGDIAALLAYVKGWEAGVRSMIAYTPGSLVTDNIVINFSQDGTSEGISIEGMDTVTDQIKQNFLDARDNGVLDLNGDGDGDSAKGSEVLPDDFLTIRDKSILTNAHGDLLKIIDWLKLEINDMPADPGTHDPQIDWPIRVTSPLFGNSLSKSEAIDLLNKFKRMLQGTESLDIDIDNDGNVDYTTKVNLKAPFHDPTKDLKTLLPDLVKASSPDDPLVVIPDTTDGVNNNWKIDGVYDKGNDDTLNTDDDVLFIDFPDPTFNGVLPKGDINNLLNLVISGKSNVLLPPVVDSSTHPNQETAYDNNDPKFSWDEPVSLSGISGYSFKLNQQANTTTDTNVDTSKTTTSYSGLNSGTYYFHIRATTNDGKWTPTTHYKIQIDLHKPTADFSYSPNEPTVKDTVEFTDQSTDEGGNIEKWQWEFGDGETSNKENPTHQYSDSGEFVIKLTVTDEKGSSSSMSKSITIKNLAPSADFKVSPNPPFVDEKVEFVNKSNDPENSIEEYRWEFGDGETSNKENPTHKYDQASKFTVTLTVKDKHGVTDEKKKEIEVSNPVNEIGSQYSNSPADVENPAEVIGKKEAQLAALSYLANEKISDLDRSLSKNLAKDIISYHLMGKEIKKPQNQDSTTETQEAASALASASLRMSLPVQFGRVVTMLDLDNSLEELKIKIFSLKGKLEYKNSYDKVNQEKWEDLLRDIRFELSSGFYLYIIKAREVDGDIKRTKLEKMTLGD